MPNMEKVSWKMRRGLRKPSRGVQKNFACFMRDIVNSFVPSLEKFCSFFENVLFRIPKKFCSKQSRDHL